MTPLPWHRSHVIERMVYGSRPRLPRPLHFGQVTVSALKLMQSFYAICTALGIWASGLKRISHKLRLDLRPPKDRFPSNFGRLCGFLFRLTKASSSG